MKTSLCLTYPLFFQTTIIDKENEEQLYILNVVSG